MAVHNFGPAIDAAIMPMLFDPFRRGRQARARGATEGLGLGLYIADQVIRAHGGKIEVESSAEAGTRFEVLFPRAACSNPPRS
jgi:signal transduction histidine kinase